MSNSNEIVPSLSGVAGEKTPVERPVKSKPGSPKATKTPEAPPSPIDTSVLKASAAFGKAVVELTEKVVEQIAGPPPPKVYGKWKVLESQEVFRGASSFLLHREQVLSEQHFDVPGLLQMGVKLERLPD